MKKLTFAMAAISVNAMAASFTQHVQELKFERPKDADKINHIALLTNDLVIHYEQAILVGTTADYEQTTLINHFNDFMYAADNQCEEINLTGCIYDLICEGEVRHNLKTSYMPCD